MAKAQGSRTLAGTEFWMTFTENIYNPADSVLHLLIAPSSRDTVQVYNPQINVTEFFPVEPGKQNIIYLKSNTLWYSRLLGSINTGVRIRSSRLIQVQAVNRLDGSTDISSILPVSVIENAREYIINHISGDAGKESQVAVLAIDTGITTIEISLKADLFTGQGNGSVFKRTLKQGQVYIMQALDTQNLSGSNIHVINTCKRIAVFCGTKCSRYPQTSNCFSCDAVYEQLLPSGYFQKEYFLVPPPDNSKYTVSVVAMADNTAVSFNGVFAGALNRGEVLKKAVSGFQLVTADFPVNCLQVMHSSGCNGATLSTSGDPSILQIAALNQTVSEARFPVLRSVKFKHHFTLFSENASKPVYKLNGAVIPAASVQQFVISGRTFWIHSGEILTNNTYLLTSNVPFVAYNYGMANAESYASICGASFERSDADFSINPSYQCKKNLPVQFTVKGDSIGNVSWLFGDGNTGTGSAPSHIYGKSGVFRVKMINSRNGMCPDTISRFVEVVDGPDLNLKDTFPCLGTILRMSLPTDRGYSYLWENGSKSFSRNFASNQTPVITITDTNGCQSKDTFTVTFKDCNNYELKLANVFTPGTDGKNDLWEVIYNGYSKIEVKIFNRWGEVIYHYTLPENEHWNGKVNNLLVDCPDGVYYYQLRATALSAKENKSVNGSINLIRE